MYSNIDKRTKSCGGDKLVRARSASCFAHGHFSNGSSMLDPIQMISHKPHTGSSDNKVESEHSLGADCRCSEIDRYSGDVDDDLVEE